MDELVDIESGQLCGPAVRSPTSPIHRYRDGRHDIAEMGRSTQLTFSVLPHMAEQISHHIGRVAGHSTYVEVGPSPQIAFGRTHEVPDDTHLRAIQLIAGSSACGHTCAVVPEDGWMWAVSVEKRPGVALAWDMDRGQRVGSPEV